ncbi:uncharacterized protein LOC126674364 [Mercurialis annua]|uniref:uncharacterized protein LOC126674364 n=1 Tax=Mercurialis annua TaxID=3986 RepID=UPI00215FA9BA|nr:uncharacterized protein LOC126674364 [Mercurialis annua]
MEDRNALVADCIVISCCCQCLVLKVIVFLFLNLPCKLVKKSIKFAKEKFRKKASNTGIELATKGGNGDEHFETCDGSFRIIIEEFDDCGKCMGDIEGVLEELSKKGEFAFGSFWGRDGMENGVVAKQEFDVSLVQFELVELVHSFGHSN